MRSGRAYLYKTSGYESVKRKRLHVREKLEKEKKTKGVELLYLKKQKRLRCHLNKGQAKIVQYQDSPWLEN